MQHPLLRRNVQKFPVENYQFGKHTIPQGLIKQNHLLKETHSCPNNKFTPYKQSSQHTTSLSGSHTFWHTEKALKGYKGAQLIISKTWSKNI